MAAPDLPETLHVADTNKTVRREDVAKLSETERARLWYTDADGHARWPFYDDTGVFGLGDAASIPPFMSRKKLTDLGWSDDKLEAERTRLFGRLAKGILALSDDLDDDIPVMERRWLVYDQVTRALLR